MSWLVTRVGILAVLFLGGGALAWAQATSEFAYVDAREESGPTRHLTLLASESEGLSLQGDAAQLTLELPATVAPGTEVSVQAVLEESQSRELGVLTLDVQESSTFLAGRIHGRIGQREFSGGLRIRRSSPQNRDTRLAIVEPHQ